MSGFASGQDMQRATVDEIMQWFELLDEDGTPMRVDELPNRRALAGEREPEAVVRFRTHPGDEDRWALVRARPLFGARGRVRNVVNVFVDITQDRHRRQTQTFLADATKELSRSLNWEATIQRVAQLAVPVLADSCAIDVLEPDGSLSIALAHVNPAKVEWARQLRQRFPSQPTDTSGIAHLVMRCRD
jgi:PAS fold